AASGSILPRFGYIRGAVELDIDQRARGKRASSETRGVYDSHRRQRKIARRKNQDATVRNIRNEEVRSVGSKGGWIANGVGSGIFSDAGRAKVGLTEHNIGRLVVLAWHRVP